MDTKQKKWINLILIIGIFVVVTIYYAVNPADMVLLRVEDETLIIEGTDGVSYQVPIESIQRLEYEENVAYAENVQDPQDVICGSFINERWGEHFLCVNVEIPACMVAYTEDGTYVFNCENEGTTKEFYEALLKIL